LVPKLGFLEYIINTPSQHRVHHGRNPYCIDKNYAGTLCIWDRLFGTFAEEKDGTNGTSVEEVKYGLVHPPPNWDPVYGKTSTLVLIV
jgi:alkylglycerol monooxygenase